MSTFNSFSVIIIIRQEQTDLIFVVIIFLLYSHYKNDLNTDTWMLMFPWWWLWRILSSELYQTGPHHNHMTVTVNEIMVFYNSGIYSNCMSLITNCIKIDQVV